MSQSSPSPWPLRGLLLLALGLFGCGLWWGLPGRWGWAGDELFPSTWPEAISFHPPNHPHLWHLRYPPFHFAVLQGVSLPLRWLIAHGAVPAGSGTVWLIVLGRLVSLAMALGTLVLVYRVGREIYDHRSSLFAVLITICIVPMVYYAKMGNLDVPYVFWFVLSLLFYVRILKEHRLRDYLLFAAAAAAAVCTKDQAYGLYALAPLPILVSLYRREYRERGALRGLLRALVDRRMLWAALTAALLFGVFEEVLFNPQRFLIHVKLLRGPMSENYQDYEDTAEGHQMLLSMFLKQVLFVLDPLLAAVCAAGVAVTGWRAATRRAKSLPVDSEDVLLGGVFFLVVSYYVTFLNLILFSYDRYLLPVAILLAFFGGRALGLLTRPGVPWLRLRQAAVAAGFIYALLYAASVDTRLLADSRYGVEAWVRQHATPPVSVAAVGRKKHIPRFPWIPWDKVLRSKGQVLQQESPQFLAVNLSDLRHPEEIRIVQQLSTGEIGYRLVFSHKGRPLFDLLDVDGVGSSQRFINPDFAVFERIGGGGTAGGVPSGASPVANSPARRSVAIQ